MSDKSTKSFQETIKNYLDDYALNDEAFAKKYSNKNKSINECCNFIISEVKKLNVNGMTDDEVYYLARHYYNEEDIKNVESINCNVVINHKVELTPEEIEEAKKEAIEQIKNDEIARIKKEQEATKIAEEKKIKKEQEKAAKKLELEKKKEQQSGQMTIFDDLFGAI